MKRFVINHLVVAALVVSAVLVSSCGKDDNGYKIKLLETITWSWGDDEDGDIMKFEYDSQNRISRVLSYRDGKLFRTETHTYSDDDLVKITIVYSDAPEGIMEQIIVRNGNTISMSMSMGGENVTGTMSLNNDGYPISSVASIGEYEEQEMIFHFHSGNLTKITVISYSDGEKNDEFEVLLTYDTNKSPLHYCKTPRWVMYLFTLNYNLGINNNVIQRIEEVATLTFVYEFDNDGFPTKQTDSIGNVATFIYK